MTLRARVRRLVEASAFHSGITALILVNAVTLGVETSETVMRSVGDVLHILDRAALSVFVAELLLKMYAYGLRFFRDPWNCFDVLVVGVSLVPAAGGVSVIRAFRVLRVLRLISSVPSMRKVVAGLLAAVPGMSSIAALLALVVYVAAVMATNLFGATSPEYFGDLGTSLWTLFQIMTGESWPDIAAELMEHQPAAWVFFLAYILLSSFVVLNLFLAVMVSALEEIREEHEAAGRARDEAAGRALGDAADGPVEAAILAELAALRAEIRALRREREEREGLTPQA